MPRLKKEYSYTCTHPLGLQLPPSSFSHLPTTSVPPVCAPTNILAATLETPAEVKMGLDARHVWLKFQVFWAVLRLCRLSVTACKDSCQNLMWHCSRPLASFAHQNRGWVDEVTAPRRQPSTLVTARSAVLDGRRNATTQTGKLLQFNTAQAPRLTHEKQFPIS